KPRLVDDHGVALFTTINDALTGPYEAAHNPAGAKALNEAGAAPSKLDAKLERIAVRPEVAPPTTKQLEDEATAAVSIVQNLGAELDIPALKRATVIHKRPLQTLVFDMSVPTAIKSNATYKKNFEDETVRQLALQETKLNQMTIDQWFVNIDTFKGDQASWIAKLSDDGKKAVVDEIRHRVEWTYANATSKSAEITKAKADMARLRDVQLRTRGYTVQQALDDLIKDTYIREAFTGRWSNEDKFRDEHRVALDELLKTQLVKWDGMQSRSAGIIKTAILHNPDQVGGGFGMLPMDIKTVKPPGPGEDTTAWDKYLDTLLQYFGASKVNGRI